ncbi:MAG: hypothetical protein M1825_000005 [Sarcosagium campestre]|nr:MAG: hypothetical protein M1825_000005 [Sarcosagium campestre]
MYATKRKFHSILNSLTPPSTANSNESTTFTDVSASASIRTSGLTSPSTFTLPGDVGTQSAKKRRLTARLSSHRPCTSQSTQSSRRIDGMLEQPTQRFATTKQPNYAPWDRTQFLRRLKTFRHVDRWTAKPKSVNEVVWAKRGWSCVGRERVGCVGGCGKELVIRLERPDQASGGSEDERWSNGFDERMIIRYVDMTVSEHDENCLWKKRGCDDGIYRLPLANPSTSIAALKSRYESLVAIATEIPSNITVPECVEVASVAKQLPSDFLRPTSEESTESSSVTVPANVNEDVLAMALFGWQAEEGHIEGLATCEACFRRLGLWLFKHKPSSSRSKTGRTAISDETPSMNRLDVVAEHRDYCPWINTASQGGISSPNEVSAGSEGSAGWQMLHRALHTAQHFRDGKDGEHSQRRLGDSDPMAPDGDFIGDSTSFVLSQDDGDSTILRDEKDKERWAKLKKLSKVFDVRHGKKVQKKPSIS